MAFPINASLLDAMVLSIVDKEDTYGYKITQDIRGAIEVSESTLYPVLRRLLKENDLETYDKEFQGRNRRYYKTTSKGKATLQLYLEEWKLHKMKIDNILIHDGSITDIIYQSSTEIADEFEPSEEVPAIDYSNSGEKNDEQI